MVSKPSYNEKMTGREQFVVDEKGRRVKVIIDLKAYEVILAKLEELESIRAYDEARASGEEPLSFEQVISEIEESRQ